MSSPPTRQGHEEPTPAANPEGGNHLPRIPRRWRDDAIRVLHGDGYAVSGAQAWDLLRRWQSWRRDDAERFIADEFLAFARKRGDLMVVRGRPQHQWRTTS